MTGDDQRIEHILNAITKIEAAVPLIHDYMRTNCKLIWQTVKHDLPELKKQLLSMISS